MWRVVAGGKLPWQPLHPTRVESRSHAVLGASEDPMPTAVQLGKGRFTRSVLDGIDGCLRLQEGRRIQNCRELLGALQAKRTDPEDLPFGRRFPVLNKFTRTRLRAVLRTGWMPVSGRVLFGWALARLVGLSFPMRLMCNSRVDSLNLAGCRNLATTSQAQGNEVSSRKNDAFTPPTSATAFANPRPPSQSHHCSLSGTIRSRNRPYRYSE